MKLSKSRFVVLAIGLIIAACLTVLGVFLSKLAFHAALRAQGASFEVWPQTGEFADLAINEEATFVIADFRSDILNESKHGKYLPLRRSGHIVEVPKGTEAEALDRYVIKNLQIRRDLSPSPSLGHLENGAIVICKIRVVSGSKKGLIGWLPEADITRKYAMP